GDLPLRAHRHGAGRKDPRPFRGDRLAATLPGRPQGDGHRVPGQLLRARQAARVRPVFSPSPILFIYAGAALTGIMIAEAVYLLYAGRSDRRAAINRRMKLQESKISQEQVLIQLRKERGLEEGASLFSFDRLRALRTQSGLVTPLPRFLTITTGAALAI